MRAWCGCYGPRPEGIGSNVFLDPLGEFYRTAGIQFVPTLWLIDAQGKVKKRRGGGPLNDLVSDFDLPKS